MIYVIIAQKSELVWGRVKKYAPLLSKSTLEYINGAQSLKTREDRLAGYTLFSLTYAMLLEVGALAPLPDGKAKSARIRKNSLKLRHIPRLTPKTIEKHSLDLSRINVSRTAAGKPYIEGAPLHFNLSHSGDAVALAISTEGEVGVDVQLAIDPTRSERLSSRFFTAPIAIERLYDVEYLYVTADDCGIVFEHIARSDSKSADADENKSAATTTPCPSNVKVDEPTEGDGKAVSAFASVLDDGYAAGISSSAVAEKNIISISAPTAGDDCTVSISSPDVDDEYTVKWSVGEAILKCDGRGFAAIGELQSIADHTNVSSVILNLGNDKYAVTVASEKL